MARSDFAFIEINHHFAADADPVHHDTFVVEGAPRGRGYLLVQAHDVEGGDHEIEINGHSLPFAGGAPNLAAHADLRWVTWMVRIPRGVLQQGQNRITIRRVGADGFSVAGVVAHWREAG
jgi:hypothetical protein